MKLLVTHDAKGNVHGVVTQPDDAPPASVALRPGRLVTAIDMPEKLGDLGDPKSRAKLFDLVKNHRIEVRTEARLMKKGARKGR